MDWGALPGLSKEGAGLVALFLVIWLIWQIGRPVASKLLSNGEKADQRNAQQTDRLLTMLQQSHESNMIQSREIAGHMAITNANLASVASSVGTVVAAVNKLANDIGINSAREDERAKIRADQWDEISMALAKLSDGRQRDAKVEAARRARKKRVIGLNEVLA